MRILKTLGLIVPIILFWGCGGTDGGDNNSSINLASDVTQNSNVTISKDNLDLVLDVDKIEVSANWREKLGIDGDFIRLTQDGKYGKCKFNGDSVTYTKHSETNATDICKFSVELEDGDTKFATVTIQSLYWKIAKAGFNYTVALKSDGTIWGWGYNHNGELGDASTTNRLTKIQETTHSHDWKMVDASGWTTYAIKEDGSLWAWGSNDLGQLGDGSDIFIHKTNPEPVKISTDNWIDISSFRKHILALKSDGSLWAWGSNINGAIGSGNTDLQQTPYQIDGTWKAISAGTNFSIAIKDDGKIYSWGSNGLGELGLGDKDNRLIPTVVVAQGELLADWNSSPFVSVSAGANHVLVIQANGTVWGWGNNGFGQLTNNGDGTDEELSPIKIDLVGVTSLSAGDLYTMGIYSDGTMRGWGDSQYGNIGANTWDVNVKTPTQEYTKSNSWLFVDAGVVHTVAIDKYGQMWIWGTSEDGLLGVADSTEIPKRIYARDFN